MTDVSDEDLVARARLGDAEAFGALVGRHGASALHLARIITGSADDAEDAAQEGFAKAYVALATFRGDSPVKPWLMRVVANEAKNRVRSSVRRQRVVQRVAQLRPLGSTAPEDNVVATFECEVVLAAIGRLSAGDREVIGLRYLAELSEAETATAIRRPVGTVKSRTARALAKLRIELGDHRG